MLNFIDKQIIHIDQDAFFVSVEIKKNSKLAGIPLIIGGMSDRGVVASCSYEARKYGVHSAMSSRLARQLCPHAVFIRGSMDDYSYYSRQITELLQQKVPLLEKASIDEHYVDMTGMDRFFGCIKFAKELKQSVLKEIGLPISFGLSINKTVSKMATNEKKPNGEGHVKKPEVRSFLDPLSIKKIPGLGDAAFLKLSEMGVRKIHTLSQIPQDLMFNLLGKSGLALWQKANGIDHSPVVPYREQKSIGKQSTFDSDSMDISGIKLMLTDMVTQLAFELRQKQKLTACITVTIRYANFETVTRQAVIPYTSLDTILLKKTKELFDQVYQKRMLLRLAGVKFSHLVSGHEQIMLYDSSEKVYNLYQRMDALRSKFGIDAVRLATLLPDKEHTHQKYPFRFTK